MGIEVNMNQIAGLLQFNFLPVVTILFMGFFLLTNHKYEPTLTSFFKQMFYLLVALLIFTNLDYQMTDAKTTGFGHLLVAVVACNLRVVLVLRLVTIMDYNITGKINKLLNLPMLINFMILMLTFFTDWVVWFDTAGVLHTNPLGFTPHIAVGLYFVYAMWLAYSIYCKEKKSECLIIMLEMAISIAGFLIECLLHIRGMMLGTVALAMIFYYLHMHICKFYKDPLTGTLNRASFYADLKQYATSIVAVYSIDLNGLKQANDMNGHEAGDMLLQSAAYLIQTCLFPGCFLYRTGGDEFVILCISMTKRQVQKVTANLFDIQTKGCDFAFGMHEFVTDVQTTFRMADDAMHANKRNMKKARKKNPDA